MRAVFSMQYFEQRLENRKVSFLFNMDVKKKNNTSKVILQFDRI